MLQQDIQQSKASKPQAVELQCLLLQELVKTLREEAEIQLGARRPNELLQDRKLRLTTFEDRHSALPLQLPKKSKMQSSQTKELKSSFVVMQLPENLVYLVIFLNRGTPL